MKKLTPVPRTSWLLSISAALALLAGGCATPERHSYNQDFGESLPAKPMYSIHDANDQHFIITVHQGTPSNGAERLLNVKEAASAVAKAECQRLGWKKWQLNYIQERDQGWMHVVVADVVRKNYTEPSFPQSKDTP